MYMDETKLQKSKESETLIQTIIIYSYNKIMEFRIEKCAKFIMKSEKRQITEGSELHNQERTRTLKEKGNYAGILEADTTKQVVVI